MSTVIDLRRGGARHKLRTPDAIEVAAGLRMGATLAVTNDEGWRKGPLVETIVLSDLATGSDQH